LNWNYDVGRVHRLESDPQTAPQVVWIFAQRLAGHSMARIAHPLNDAAAPCPSATDPERNPHRSGKAWTLHTVRAILGQPPLYRSAQAQIQQGAVLPID
jgi:hypothetical protein